ncbi:MAG: ATP-binding cassette domain-containing protein [Coriobacteriales bacterium]|nr:ATP-binding cassette domain-containing protein [Coriobacteriales bacterium]
MKQIKDIKNPYIKFGIYLVVLVFWLAIWQLISVFANNYFLIAGPIDTFFSLFNNIQTGEFWLCIATSFLRIVLAYIFAFFLAVVFAFFSYKSSAFNYLVSPLISFIKSVPVVCIIIVLLVCFGNNFACFIAVGLMVLPQIYYSSLEGIESCKKEMLQLLDLFELNKSVQFKYYILPCVLKHMKAAIKVSVAISWKAGVACEVIALPQNSIGWSIYTDKILLDTASIFSWIIVIIAISKICEIVVLFIYNRLYVSLSKVNYTTDFSKVKYIKSSIVPAIQISNLNFKYENSKAFILEDFSYKFLPGKSYIISAPTGSGKTTLINLICGFYTSPFVEFVSQDSNNPINVKQKAKISLCPQDDLLFDELSAYDNVRLFYNYVSINSSKNTRELLDEMLQTDSQKLKISECSGGMKRIISIFRAIEHQGDIVILDEPFTGLDSAIKEKLVRYILSNLGSRTLILISHDSANDAAKFNAQICSL